MSIRIEFKCSKCGNVISPLSKKGFISLHSKVGIPILKCINCNSLIKTDHKAFSDFSIIGKTIEWIKAILSSLFIAVLFGGMFGFLIGMFLDEYFPINNFSHNIYTIPPLIFLITYLLNKTKREWFEFSDKFKSETGNIIDSNLYEHPDW